MLLSTKSEGEGCVNCLAGFQRLDSHALTPVCHFKDADWPLRANETGNLPIHGEDQDARFHSETEHANASALHSNLTMFSSHYKPRRRRGTGRRYGGRLRPPRISSRRM